MKSRDIAVFAVALVLAIGVAFVTRLVLQTKQSEAVVVQGQSMNTTPVLVAKNDLSVGTTLNEQMTRWQEWPTDSVDSYHFTPKKEKQQEALFGSIVRYPINKGEPIKTANLILKNDRSVLSAVVGAGMRAFTIALDRKTNVSGWLAPGDLVDVIVASRQKGANRNYSGKTIVTKVLVLAVDAALQKDESKRGDKQPQTVTIEVTPEQSETLAAALREGEPVISLHSFSARGSDKPVVKKVKSRGSSEVALLRGDETEKIEVKE